MSLGKKPVLKSWEKLFSIVDIYRRDIGKIPNRLTLFLKNDTDDEQLRLFYTEDLGGLSDRTVVLSTWAGKISR